MSITQIIQLVCNSVVLVIAIFTLISALIGLKKGFVSSFISLVLWGVALAIVYGFNMKFTELYFGVDISLIMNIIGITTFTVNNVDISLCQNIGGIITDFMNAFDLAEATEAVSALAMSFLSFVVLIINLILCLIIVPILKFIIYRLILKPLVEKVLKKKKLRLVGFFTNGLKTAMVSVLMLSPLFVITENLSKSVDEGLSENYQYSVEKSNEYWNYVYPFVDVYNNSLAHKLFSVITGSGTRNGYFTASINNEAHTNVNFIELIDGTVSVASAALSTIEELSQGSITAAILADHTLEVFADQILSSAFLMGEVLPVVLTIGVEMFTNMEYSIIDKESGDLIAAEIGDIDFSADLISYINLFRILNREGLITDSLLEQDTFDYELSRDNQMLLNEALSSFKKDQDSIKNDPNKTTILDVILPPLLSSLVKNLSSEELPLNKMLPTTPDEYRSFDIIELLQVVSDVLFNINELYKGVVSVTPSANVLNKTSIKTQKDEVDNLSFGTLSLLMQDNNLLKTLFSRNSIFDGVLDTRDENQTDKITTLNLFAGNDKDKGLFDIQFLLDNFPNVIDFALSSFTTGDNSTFVLDDNVINDVVTIVSSYDSKEDWVNEIDALLDCVGILFDNEDLPVLVLNDSGQIITEDIKIENAATQAVIKELCDCIDRSTIIVKVFPSILKSSLDLNSIPMLAQYGISIDDFNFDRFSTGSTLGSEVKDLIDGFAMIMDMDFSENILTSDSIDSDELYHAFEYMFDCEIINPEPVNNDCSSNVLRKVVLGMLNSSNMEEIGLSLDSDLYDEKLINGTLLQELRNICDIIDVIKDSDGLTSMINSSEGISISDLEGKDIEDLVTALAHSDFLRPCLSNVIQKQLSPVFDDMGINSNYLNYELMDDASAILWEEEGSKLADIIDELKNITDGNIENVDWVELITNTEKRNDIKTLFTSLQSLHFLEGEYIEDGEKYDRFGLVIYSLLESSLDDYIDESNKNQIRKDFSFAYYNEIYQKCLNDESIIVNEDLSRNELWEIEIDKLLDVFSNIEPLLKDNGESKVLEISTIDESNIDDIITLIIGKEEFGNRVYGINDLTIFRTILTSILDKSIGDGSSLNMDGFDMSDAYIHTDVFKKGNELNFESSLVFKNFALLNEEINLSKESISYRDAEIILRRNEISNLLNITRDIINLGEFSVDNLSIWVNDNVIGGLLSDLHNSLIMNSPVKALEKGKLTAFEKIIDIILDSSVSSMIYENRDEHVSVIQKITNSELNGGVLSWNDETNGEISKLSNALQNINELKDENGEDTPLKKYILGASDAPSSIDLVSINEDVENREIEIIIKSLAKSKLINPDDSIDVKYANNSPLGKLFDDNIGSSLEEIGMSNHSFKKTDLFKNDWDKEAETLSILVNSVKDITRNDDGTYGSLSSIDYSNYESLGNIVNAIYDIPSINAVYDESQHASSFADFVYYAISDSYLTNEKITQEEKDQIKLDIYEVESLGNSDYWKDKETGDGEISKLIELIKVSGEECYGILLNKKVVNENFTKIYTGVDGNNGNTLPGVAMLKNMNDITFLRTVLSSLIRTELSSIDFELGSFNTNKIYSPLFAEIMNKDVDSNLDRNDEKQLREEEIDKLVDIIDRTIKLEGILDEDAQFSRIENDVDTIIDMLDIMVSSSFFHKNFYGINRLSNETTFFEDVIVEILKNSVSDFIYKNDETEMKEVIIAISNKKNSLSWNDNNSGELYRLRDAIKTISFLKDENGEDTELRKFILGKETNEIALTNLNENNYAGNEKNEIEILLKGFASSNLFNPCKDISSKYENYSLLGRAFDEKIGTSLKDMGMENHSFARVDLFDNNWDEEAKTLSAVVNELKKLDSSDDLANIKWADVEDEKLKTLLLSIYKVPSIVANYGVTDPDFDGSIYDKSSYEDLIYHIINVSFNVDSDGDGIGDTYQNSDLKEISFDIYSVGNEYSWFTNNELNNLEESNPGQTNMFINLFEDASSRGYGIIIDGKFVADNFTEYSTNKNAYGIEILYELNEIYFLRTAFASLMKNTFVNSSGFDVGGLSTNKIYAEAFNEVINFKLDADHKLSNLVINNREDEVNRREEEISYLVDVVKYSKEINDILEDATSSLVSFSSEDISTAFDLLRSLKNSRLFHVGRFKQGGTYDTTFFEDAVMMVFDHVNMDDLIYDESRDSLYGNKEVKLSKYIKAISLNNVFDEDANNNGKFDNDEYLTWDKELDALETSFKEISSIDGLVNEDGDIIVNDLKTSDCNTVLSYLNNAYLTQDSLGNTMKNIYNKIGLDEYQIDKNELDKVPDYYLDNINSIDFVSSIEKWNKEINNICDTKDVFGDSISNFDFAVENQNISGILDVTSKSNIMEPMFADFLYSIFEKAGLEQYISSINESNNPEYASFINDYDGDAYEIEKSRRDTIEYLKKVKVVSWEFEGAILDDMIHQMNDLSTLDINDASNEVAAAVNNLFATVYDYSGADYDYDAVDFTFNISASLDMINEEKYNRGYLASELMLNFLDEKMNTEKLHVTYFENIKYDYSYICFNDYERAALESIILLAAEFNSYKDIETLIMKFDASYSKHMGPGNEIDSPKRDENKVLLDDGWNSNIAIQLLNSNYLEGIINTRFNVNISNVFTSDNKPIEYSARNEWSRNLIAATNF